ncbi:hypothetical protein [Arthrobacter sp. UM1]|uniref:hypothetical protein n=1 Tax=Arthrobacter sp. UM1 TaxID=2766776 RepID=UPI001CF690F1|nr:hypothetical protein [Arthrobacter sp. UM1]MCB4208613.1 hypothetical protein [Arthrobacter sp. UM1]
MSDSLNNPRNEDLNGRQEGFPQAPSHEGQGGFPNAPQGDMNHQGGQFAGQPGYGQGGFENGQPGYVDPAVAPKQHRTSVMLYVASLVLSLISGIIGFSMLGDLSQQVAQDSGGQVTTEQARGVMTAALVGGLLLGLVLNGIFILFWAKGHGWARIVLTVLAVFTFFGLFSQFGQLGNQPVSSILSILSGLAFLAATVIAWLRPVSEWLKAKKAAKFQAMR